jgi:hypothetical protein
MEMPVDVSAESLPTVERYSGDLLSSDGEIQALAPLIRRSLPHYNVLLDPEYFLSSMTKLFVPRVVVVHRFGKVAGIVCAKQRITPGFRLGAVHTDLTLGSPMSGSLAEQEDGFLKALETLFRSGHIHGLRLRIRPRSPELAAVQRLRASCRFDIRATRVRDHVRLALPGNYEELLKSLGKTTRRNFRYYRRRFEAEGHRYVDNLSLDDARSAVSYLEKKSKMPGRPDSVETFLRVAALGASPLIAGLKHRDGNWMSIVLGMYTRTGAVVLLQLNNDREFPRNSLSVVLRGYLIESLIGQGMEELLYWGGAGPPLARYVDYVPSLLVHIDRRIWWWRLARGVLSRFSHRLPSYLREDPYRFG